MTKHYSVIIPVFNEAAFFPGAFKRLQQEMSSADVPWDLIVVENGSTDGTGEIVTAILESWDGKSSLLHLPDPDYGAALKKGLLAGQGDWLITFDIDYLSGDFVQSLADADADIVIASKRAEGSDDQRPWVRRMGTWGFNQVLHLLLGSEVGDTHGIKAFSHDVVADVTRNVVRTKDLFDTELIIRAERKGYRILELPVVVEEHRAAGSPFLKRIPRTLWGIIQLRRLLPSKTRSR
jgi:glycosyltransferase involved in cell wall biosynthesis